MRVVRCDAFSRWVLALAVCLGWMMEAALSARRNEPWTGSTNLPVTDVSDGVPYPLESCLANVVLLIYVQHLPRLKHLNFYRSMYAPFFKAVEFYVDGTWCDPRLQQNTEKPCFGKPLDRSLISPRVHVIDGLGGGWLMQKCLIDAEYRYRTGGGGDHEDNDSVDGFFFATDDMVLNVQLLSRAAQMVGCDKVWRSGVIPCEDFLDANTLRPEVYGVTRYPAEVKAFYDIVDDDFRESMVENFGNASVFCTGRQNDVIYIPRSITQKWAHVARMTIDVHLPFPFAFYTAVFGIVLAEDMVVLRTKYLKVWYRPENVLESMRFDAVRHCWCPLKGTYPREYQRFRMNLLLSMHVIHPVKLSTVVGSEFALTVNSYASVLSHVPVDQVRSLKSGPIWCSDRA